MSFLISEPKLDIGETPLENMFINNFMGKANAAQLKVYLAGLYLARSKKTSSNLDIAKILDLDLKEIEEAFRYWEAQGLVKEDFGNITYLSVRELYLSSNYKARSPGLESSRDDLILKQADIIAMFQKAEEYMNTALGPEARLKYLRLMEEYGVSAELLLKAIELTYVEAEKPTRSYTEAILKKWRDKGVDSLEKVKLYDEEFKQRQALYKEVNERLLAKSTRPTPSQIAIIDKFLDSPGGEGLTLEAADYVSLHYKSATYSNYSSLYKKLEEEGLLSGEGLAQYRERHAKSTSPKVKEKPRQNFSQDTYKKMTKDEGMKAMQYRNPALKVNRRKSDDR